MRSGPGRFRTIPGYGGPFERTGDDVQHLSVALLLLTTTSEKTTFETADNPPPEHSAARRLWRESEAKYALDEFLTMQFANMSAYDHVRGFVALIRTATVRSTALATIARGALESLARTWYLLADADGHFIYRVLSLLRSDLRFPDLLGESVSTRDGDLEIRVDTSSSSKRRCSAHSDQSAMFDSVWPDDSFRDATIGRVQTFSSHRGQY